MNIQTDKQLMVFRKDTQYGTNYSIGLSRKDKDGKYCNAYIPVRFKSGELEDKTKIYIKNGFLTFYLKQDKTPVFYLMIMDYETTDEAIENAKTSGVSSIKQEDIQEEDPFVEFGKEIEIKPEDLPF